MGVNSCVLACEHVCICMLLHACCYEMLEETWVLVG